MVHVCGTSIRQIPGRQYQGSPYTRTRLPATSSSCRAPPVRRFPSTAATVSMSAFLLRVRRRNKPTRTHTRGTHVRPPVVCDARPTPPPTVRATVSTTTPTSAVQVHTAQGTRTLVPTITSTKFDKTVVPPCIRAFLDVAHAIVGALPKSSASSIDASLRSFRAFVEWSGEKFETTVPSPEWLIAYIVARSTPAVGTPLPDDKAFHRPVLPTTAVGDVDDLRRGARIGVASLARWSEALNHESVFAFSKEVGGRISKLRTNKRPFLFTKVVETWKRWGPQGLGAGSTRKAVTALRDAAAIVLAFFFGCRAGEISAFHLGDVSIVGDRVRLTFKSRKNRRSVLGIHQHQVITASHPLLLEAMILWTARARGLGATPTSPLFPKTTQGRASVVLSGPMSTSSLRYRCKEIDPLCVAHSLRAGMATEAWAAGVPVPAIMALGGWSSPVAVMYIIGAVDETVAASQRLGTAGMRFDGEELRASLGTSRLLRSTWHTE